MRMAEHAGAPVLVVGDIDRGGVFAAFVGTMEVLAPWERQLVAGWIVNRFRGDAGLLAPALDYTLRRTGRPVLGVVPYLAVLDLPQEDSVEFKSGGWTPRRQRRRRREAAAATGGHRARDRGNRRDRPAAHLRTSPISTPSAARATCGCGSSARRPTCTSPTPS